MQIKYRSFPHPVLSHFSDDYLNCAFQSRVVVNSTATDYSIECTLALSDSGLRSLISDGKAAYGIHIESKATRFRTLFTSSAPKFGFSLPASSLYGTVEVCSLLLASDSIGDYSNQNFHSEFSGHDFHIARGDILAVATDRTFEADSFLDQLKKVPSIFRILPNAAEPAPPMETDFTGNNIVILLPKETFEKYRYLKQAQDLQPAMASMLIVPVLVDILSFMKIDIDAAVESFGQLRWFKSLEKRLAEIGCSLNSEELENQSATTIAWELLEDPFSKALVQFEAFAEDEE